MTQPTTCCCHSPDARECMRMRMRYPREPDADEAPDMDEEGCECVCHQFDLDGEKCVGSEVGRI
jgi:hypothetical protein